MAADSKWYNVGAMSTLLSTIKALNRDIIDYTVKDNEMAPIRKIVRLPSKRGLKLSLSYDNIKSAHIIHKYDWADGDLLCWVYIFGKIKRVYSYLNGEFLGASTLLEGFTMDDIC